MRRPLLALLGLFLLALGVVALRAEAADAADEYPVSYNFLSSAVLAGTQHERRPARGQRLARASRPRGTRGRSSSSTARSATRTPTGRPTPRSWPTRATASSRSPTASRPARRQGLDQFGGLDEIEKSAAALKTFVAKVRSATGAKQVDLVGHSQGTLMPNYWLKFLGGAPYVQHYVSLAPLWHGTEHRAVRAGQPGDGGLRQTLLVEPDARLQGLQPDVLRLGVHGEDARRGSGGEGRRPTPTSSRSTTSW